MSGKALGLRKGLPMTAGHGIDLGDVPVVGFGGRE